MEKYRNNLCLGKEFEDLKFQFSSSNFTILEIGSKTEELKVESKELLAKICNNISKSTEFNNRPPLVSSVRGAGRKNVVS